MATHATPDLDRHDPHLFIAHIYSQPWRWGALQGPRGCTLDSEPAGLRGRLCRNKRVWCLLAPTGLRLACSSNCWLAGEYTPCGNKRELRLVPFIRRAVWLGDLISGAEWWGPCGEATGRLVSPDDQQHIRVNCNCRPCTTAAGD